MDEVPGLWPLNTSDKPSLLPKGYCLIPMSFETPHSPGAEVLQPCVSRVELSPPSLCLGEIVLGNPSFWEHVIGSALPGTLGLWANKHHQQSSLPCGPLGPESTFERWPKAFCLPE